MQRPFLGILLLTICTLPSTLSAQDFYSLTSKVFFNADIKRKDSALIKYFEGRPELTRDTGTGWTSYPLLNNGNNVPYGRFSFLKHPRFFNFKDGSFLIIANLNSKEVIGMVLSISFPSKEKFDSTYISLKENYSKYSAKIIHSRNDYKSYTETKYVSKNGKDFVILSTSEGEGMSHLSIYYNFSWNEW